jgi:hypothetical protein
MRIRPSYLLSSLFALSAIELVPAQTAMLRMYGARGPATCASRKEPARGAPSVEQAVKYFICDNESLVESVDHYELHLVSDVRLEVGKGRPFDMFKDNQPADEDLNPSPRYPIKGSFVAWTCGPVNSSQPDKNCMKYVVQEATGLVTRLSRQNGTAA